MDCHGKVSLSVWNSVNWSTTRLPIWFRRFSNKKSHGSALFQHLMPSPNLGRAVRFRGIEEFFRTRFTIQFFTFEIYRVFGWRAGRAGLERTRSRGCLVGGWEGWIDFRVEYSSQMRVGLVRQNLADGAAPAGLMFTKHWIPSTKHWTEPLRLQHGRRQGSSWISCWLKMSKFHWSKKLKMARYFTIHGARGLPVGV